MKKTNPNNIFIQVSGKNIEYTIKIKTMRFSKLSKCIINIKNIPKIVKKKVP